MLASASPSPDRRNPHDETVDTLKALGMVSAYHQYYRLQEHGGEPDPTWYMHKRTKFAYHIDYCFIPLAWARNLRAVTVGSFEAWRPYSDHCPLIVDVWL